MRKKANLTLVILFMVTMAIFPLEAGVLVEKGDILENFESGDLDNWEIVSGNLKKQPASTWREGIRFNQEGKYFIGTTETGGSKRADFDDKLTGELRSKPFIIKRNFISLLVGGGNDPENLFIALVRSEDRYVIKKATGIDSEEMKRIYWDVSDYIGELCFFLIVDNSKGDWGHINVDDIRTCDTREEVTFSPLVISGAFNRIYNPGIGEKEKWYINDHCFIRAKDGTWHLFGITREEPASPLDEDNLAHATSPKLTQFPWKKEAFALSVSPDPWKEEHLWAPYVILHDNTYYMFYCAGDKDGSRYKIHLATSKDLWKWERRPQNPMVVDGFDARDPFITRTGDKWVMYYTANSKPEGGNYVVAYRTSNDLVKWGERKIAFTDPSIGKGGGPTESPFVVRRGEYYYLFIGPRGGYVGTDIFQSRDPFHFPLENLVGHVESHAAEVIRDTDGRWYVSHSGWGQGGVYLAPLYWNDGMDNVDTSLPVPGK